MTVFKRILVPVDFSECSRCALQMALKLAGIFKSKLRVVHVWQPPDFAAGELLVMAHAEGLSVGQYGQQKASEALKNLLQECGAADTVESEVSVGDPRHCVVDLARTFDADLIVVGTHGRTGRARMFAGSVAEAIVRRAHVPVLTVQEPA